MGAAALQSLRPSRNRGRVDKSTHNLLQLTDCWSPSSYDVPRNFDPNRHNWFARYSEDVTALMAACRTGSVPMVIELLELGADYKIRDSLGRNARMMAVEYGPHPALGQFFEEHVKDGTWVQRATRSSAELPLLSSASPVLLR